MDYTVTTPAIRDLTLSKDIRQILDDLDSGGYVIIRGATNIESVAQGSLDYVRREVVFNETVRSVLFSARNDYFRITACRPFKADSTCEGLGRDPEWQKMASTRGLVGAMCYHLGGDKNVVWKVRVNRSSKDGEEVEIQACGGDIFLCQHWLLRSKPFLQTTRPRDTYQIVISYLWNGYSKRGGQDPLISNKLLESFPTECCVVDQHVVWKPIIVHGSKVQAPNR